MQSSLGRFLCWVQAASGVLAFAVLAVAGPVLVPRISTQLSSALSSTQSAQRMAAMTEELITREQKVLVSALGAADSIMQSMSAMKEPMTQVAQNAAYWGERLAPLAGAAADISRVLASASDRLPVSVPTSLSVETRKVSLPLGSLEVPVGLSVNSTPFFTEEKKGLEKAARDLSEASSRMAESSRLMKTGGGGLSRDALESLAAAEKSLNLARSEMAYMHDQVLPGFLAEARTQKEDLAKASSGASAASAALWPALIAALVFSILWALNGLMLLTAFRRRNPL
ncbi:MAG: hypothetical protein AB1921_01860 [Thermodesulfobacteriota bacterium]